MTEIDGAADGVAKKERRSSSRTTSISFWRRPFEMTPEQRDEFRKKQQALEAELVSSLPMKDQAMLQQVQAEREKQFQEMQTMTEEQRRARFAQMGGGMDRSNRDRVRNSTQEQRVEQTRRMLEMRARMLQNPQPASRQ